MNGVKPGSYVAWDHCPALKQITRRDDGLRSNITIRYCTRYGVGACLNLLSICCDVRIKGNCLCVCAKSMKGRKWQERTDGRCCGPASPASPV